MTTIDVEIRAWEELTRDEAYELLQLRNEVFVVGQEITRVPEIDGRDPSCHHVLARDAEGELVGTARIFVDRDPVKVGRVAVHRDRQRQGIGTAVMEAVQSWLDGREGKVHAQAYLEDWYRRLGWERQGEVFEEAGIDHVLMRWRG